ncbi:hypothetical protein ACSSS7_007728 [Eimeria intestinalis]
MVADAFFSVRINTWRVPHALLSDSGPQFSAALFTQLNDVYGIRARWVHALGRCRLAVIRAHQQVANNHQRALGKSGKRLVKGALVAVRLTPSGRLALGKFAPPYKGPYLVKTVLPAGLSAILLDLFTAARRWGEVPPAVLEAFTADLADFPPEFVLCAVWPAPFLRVEDTWDINYLDEFLRWFTSSGQPTRSSFLTPFSRDFLAPPRYFQQRRGWHPRPQHQRELPRTSNRAQAIAAALRALGRRDESEHDSSERVHGRVEPTSPRAASRRATAPALPQSRPPLTAEDLTPFPAELVQEREEDSANRRRLQDAQREDKALHQRIQRLRRALLQADSRRATARQAVALTTAHSAPPPTAALSAPPAPALPAPTGMQSANLAPPSAEERRTTLSPPLVLPVLADINDVESPRLAVAPPQPSQTPADPAAPPPPEEPLISAASAPLQPDPGIAAGEQPPEKGEARRSCSGTRSSSAQSRARGKQDCPSNNGEKAPKAQTNSRHVQQRRREVRTSEPGGKRQREEGSKIHQTHMSRTSSRAQTTAQSLSRPRLPQEHDACRLVWPSSLCTLCQRGATGGVFPVRSRNAGGSEDILVPPTS